MHWIQWTNHFKLIYPFTGKSYVTDLNNTKFKNYVGPIRIVLVLLFAYRYVSTVLTVVYVWNQDCSSLLCRNIISLLYLAYHVWHYANRFPWRQAPKWSRLLELTVVGGHALQTCNVYCRFKEGSEYGLQRSVTSKKIVVCYTSKFWCWE